MPGSPLVQQMSEHEQLLLKQWASVVGNQTDIGVAEAFLAGGLSAIARIGQSGEVWHYVQIALPETASLETGLLLTVRPLVEDLAHAGLTNGYWYMLKGSPRPQIRLRFRVRTEHLLALEEQTTQRLETEVAEGRVSKWTQLLYEPEVALFGGQTGIDTAHAFFEADTRFFLSWLHLRSEGGAEAMELSLYAMQHLLVRCGLEETERWDVWQRLTAYRPISSPALADLFARHQAAYAEWLSTPPEETVHALPEAIGSAWEQYLHQVALTAQHLRNAAEAGSLGRGLRQIITFLVLFHWNRWLIPATRQGIMAQFMAHLTDPSEIGPPVGGKAT